MHREQIFQEIVKWKDTFSGEISGLKRLSSSVEAALNIDAETTTAIAIDNIEMHLENQEVYRIDTYFRFSWHFQFGKWYYALILYWIFVH